jgi:hypothetical protein
MADKKISELTTITTVDNATDLFPIVDTSASETKKITPTALKTALSLNNVDNTSDANKAISSATQTALDLKVDENAAITGATKTKITYDAKGLVTAGADATTADIADSTNKRYVTDAQATVIGNTSGTNTGDNATNSQYSGLAASIDLKTNKLIVANRQTASYTLVLTDADKLVETNVATANNLTIPLNSSVAFATGTQILLAQYGAGQTTIVATSGVTIRSNGAKVKLNAQYSGATLIKIDTNEWYLFGDIAT